ncbi:MAG: diguanylate cyclase [Rhodocyclaceae bacterium]|nr:diguanylate cyclase [Rhodocyclaceae bacterium]MBP6279401.1 diguanylate cyclase [Rhodocyclaceae bacterium]
MTFGLFTRHLFSTLLSIVLCVCVASAAERSVDVAQKTDEPIRLTEYFGVLIDSSKDLTIADVAAPRMAGKFIPSLSNGSALGFAYTDNAIWLSLRVKNTSDHAVERVFEIAYALLAKVDFYQPSMTGFQLTALGYARPVATQPHRSRFIVVPFSVPANTEQTIFIRVESANSLHIPARIWDEAAFVGYEHASYSVQAMYFGIVLGLALYNLMLFYALRDASYLFYVLFALSVSMALAGYGGLGQEFIWGDHPRLSMSATNIFSCIAGVAILLFTRRVLNTKPTVPMIDLLISFFIAANSLAFFALLLWFEAFTPIFAAISGMTAVFLLLTGVIFTMKRQRSGYYFLAAFAVIFVGVALAHMRNLGLVPTNVFTADGAQIGSAIEMLLLSFALADRYNALRRENQQVQADALQAKNEMIARLQDSELMLESKVSQRTLELNELNQKLEAMSTTDSLTGIANRRRFDAVLASEWERAKRLGQPLALAMVDVDWFKKFNDRYGHQAGDECLRRVALSLSASIGRAGDLVARYGGEEFAFIAPTTNGERAYNMAVRACETVDALLLTHADSAYGNVTISIGIASIIPRDGITADDLIGAADKALYSAKTDGRNRVVLAGSLN